MNLSILEAVFVTSLFWLFICAVVSLSSYVNGFNHSVNGFNHSDDSLNWSTDFSQVWKKGWNHGAECILDLTEKYDLATIRQTFENLKKLEENPPE